MSASEHAASDRANVLEIFPVCIYRSSICSRGRGRPRERGCVCVCVRMVKAVLDIMGIFHVLYYNFICLTQLCLGTFLHVGSK